jgi:hypothetical protein
MGKIFTFYLVKKNLNLANLFSFLLVFIFTNALTQGSDSRKEKHYSSKDVYLFDKNVYSLSGFDSKVKKNVSLDVLKMIDEAYLEHPDLGYSVHPTYKDAIELVDKRDFYSSTYLMPDGVTIFSSSTLPLNYIDSDGWFREIVYDLDEQPILNNVFRAGNQPIPKTIDALTGRTSFETHLGNISINQNSKLKFLAGVNEFGSVFSLNTNQREIGKNGLFVVEAYPKIDMQVILMKNGYVKTNYILKDRSAINSNAEFMVFEDIVTLPEGMRFDFDTDKGIHNGNEQDWEGSLIIRNEDNKEVFNYMSPFIYDDNYTDAMMNLPVSSFSQVTESLEQPGVDSDAFTYAAYRVEKINETKYKVSVVVKTEWLLAEERSFPIVIDPVTFTGVELNLGANIPTGGNCANDGGAAPAGEGGGRACARRVSGTTPVDNPGPNGVGCYCSTTVLPAGYMLVANQPVRVLSGYATRGCAASSTWMKYYGPCGMFPRESGFFFFCNTTLTNVDCGAPAGGHSMDGIVSRCMTSGGEDCATATPPSCANQTITFNVCYQSRCFAQAAGTCVQRSNVNATNYVEGLGVFRVDVLGEKITTTLAGNPASGSSVCPNVTIPLTLTTRWGVPNALNTSNCSDQMGGTYSWTATCTGGTLSAASGTTNTTGGFAAATTWNSGAVPGTYTITVTVCNTACPAPAGTMCDVRTLTYTVGNAIPPVVSDVDACNNVNGTATISNPQAGYTYTWYTNAAGSAGAATGTSRSYPAVNGTTQTYSVRATSPCASTLVTFTITWGPLPIPAGANDAACPGDIATLTADCGGNCRWYTVAAGGTALTSAAPITIAPGSLTVNPVSTTVTYYVENFVSAGCISTRIPLTISTNGLTVTTNPSVIDPICSPTTAGFTTSVSGNVDVASLPVTNAGSNVMEDNSPCTGPDCTAANSGSLTVATPASVSNPLTANSIQRVCFQMNGTAWCGNETRFYLKSPAGTIFTLYGGRAKNDKTQDATDNFCFDDIATATITAPTMGAGQKIADGTYLADGGSLSNAFVGEAAATGSLWTIYAVDNTSGSCGSGTASISNFTITFGVASPPTYSWTGGPAGGTLTSSVIPNPTYTPPATNYNSTYTVTVTDARGCTGIGTVNVICTTLPIELLSFYGDLGDRDNYLYWKTASEEQSDYIEVQRSTDGENFNFIGKLDAAKNSTTITNYEFVDKNRMKGINYYRLKMVDLNGQYEYSNIISLETKDENINVELIPNPATSMIDIKYVINFETETEIKIYDSKGSIVNTYKNSSKKGINSFILDLENYSKGIYSVVLNNDGVISTSRFIKQ